MLPPIEDRSLAQWIEATLLGLLQPEGAPIARACGPDRSLELVCTELGVGRQFEGFAVVAGALRLIVRLPDETISDIVEHELLLGRDDLVDWRLQRDTVIPGAVFWRSGIYGHTAQRQAELAAGVETWHRFLREVIDPNFVGRTPDAGESS
ncbi:hypothetical protein [Enhygromyxa salina]|uniref:hypothetical protein n=1 Tax=Enhygromyxa salina TaxID=215803 RepID=UPI0011BAE174|nr:hypothetical protein [Enhygromyxa salina]